MIEFDSDKRAWTLEVRRLDFADAGAVLDDTQFTQPDKRHNYGEARNVTYGLFGNHLVVVVWTQRGEARRIISMRYANEREIAKYTGALG